MNMPKPGKLIFALLLMVCCFGIVSAQDLGAPQNFSVSRSGDTFNLSWDPPVGEQPSFYQVDIRWRESSDAAWINPGGIGGIAGAATSVSLDAEQVQNYPDPPVFLYAVRFSIYGRFGGAIGPTAGASWQASSSSGSSSGGRSGRNSYVYKPPPKLHTCDIITKSDGDILISAPAGLTSGIQCQHIDGAGIGIQSIIDAGYIDAVDVWGLVPEATVCFKQGDGNFLFLDAATSPRSVSSIEGFDHDSMRCTTITGPGSIVLVPLFA